MKKKIVSTIAAVAVCATCMGAAPPPARTAAQYANTVTIGVAKDFAGMNILTDTEAAYEYGWVYNMVYDRLFSVGNDGRLIPGLAVGCELLGDVEPLDIFTSEQFLPNTSTYRKMGLLKQSNDDEYPYPDWMYDTDFSMFTDELLFLSRGGGGNEVYMRVTLRDDAQFANGESITSQTIIDFVNMCHNQPSNTVVHKIWSTVSYVSEAEDGVFELHFNIADYTHGFIDFIYEIASPYGGIVNPYGEENIGSGAYIIEDSNDSGVTLRQNEYWWGEPVNTETVKFIYASVKEVFENGDVDILQTSDWQYFEYNYDATIVKVATNPLVCLYNIDNEVLSNEKMRKALSVAIGYDYPSDTFSNFLLSMSNGYWAVTQVQKSSSIARYYIYESGWEGIPIELKLIYCEQSGIEVKALSEYIQDALAQVGIIANLQPLSAIDYKKAVQSGNYDMALSYVDLNDTDSAYKTFYPTYDEELNAALDHTILVASTRSFMSMQYYVQKSAYEKALFMNFGWKAQAFVHDSTISGVNYFEYKGYWYSAYRPIYALSDANLVDFRWVAKQA